MRLCGCGRVAQCARTGISVTFLITIRSSGCVLIFFFFFILERNITIGTLVNFSKKTDLLSQKSNINRGVFVEKIE